MAVLLPEEFRTLFLGDLSIHCTRQDVLYLFNQFGSIERITLKVGASMKGLGYGFLSYSNRESAEAAMTALQGVVLLGRAIRISWATPRGQTHLISKEPNKSTKQTAEVHFSFLTKQTRLLITEATIRAQYEKFGEIVDVVIKRTKLNQKLNFQNGYGFVRYPLTSDGIQAAINATKYMHQILVDGINYDTHLTHALETLLERISPEILRDHQLSKMSTARHLLGDSPNQRGLSDESDFAYPAEFEYLAQERSYPQQNSERGYANPTGTSLHRSSAPEFWTKYSPPPVASADPFHPSSGHSVVIADSQNHGSAFYRGTEDFLRPIKGLYSNSAPSLRPDTIDQFP